MDYRTILQESLDYIEDNLRTQISARELAERAGFSLFHYYRLFQTATGMPVMQFILRRRLLHGIYKMYCGSTGIEAALEYGFDTYAGFYRAFQREFGCTPSMYLDAGRARRPCRLNLFREEHIMVTRKKAAGVLKYWNLGEEPIAPVYYDGTGSQNENAYYVGNDYVLKFTGNLGRLKNHIALSRAMESVGLYAATPVAAADGREYICDGETYYCVTRRVPGRQMVSGDFYEGDSAGKARFVGEILGQLHLALCNVEGCTNEGDLYTAVKDWALPTAKDTLGLSEAFCREYLAALGTLHDKLPRQIIHRDPNPGNILCGEDKWGFIDFELSERNVRIYDPCYAATAILSESFGKDNGRWLEICQSLLLGYDTVAHLTGEEWKAVPYVILANQLICTAWFAGQERYADLFETNRQMTLWLVDIFEELKKLFLQP